MGCPAIINLGDNLVFSIATHDPETGGLVNADSLPQFKIYSDETPAPILSGEMVNRPVGFYYKLVACTATNGFETGKSYTVDITATVSQLTGGINYAFSVNKPTLIVNYALSMKPTSLTVTAATSEQATAVNVGESEALQALCNEILSEVEKLNERGDAAIAAGDDALIAAHLARLGQ